MKKFFLENRICLRVMSSVEITQLIYLLIDLDVNSAKFSAVANQRREFMEIFQCDWLPAKVRQKWRRGRLSDIVGDNLRKNIPLKNFSSTINWPEASCDLYRMADYEFVNNYCYANMADYDVNQATGEVDLDSKVNLRPGSKYFSFEFNS